MPTFPVEGGCVCGAIRFRLTEDPLGLHVCHCTDCQRLTGSAFVMSMPILRRTLELLSGQATPLRFETTWGRSRCDRRCKDCGCRIWSEKDETAEVIMLRPGTLDDHSWLHPIAHVWTRSAQPWIEIPADVLRYEKEAEDGLELVRAWKARSQA